jgi:uncharacterized protein YihD (DUF1040 family)
LISSIATFLLILFLGGDAMRDPDRIDRILNKLYIAWSRNPDLRLGQLISNLNNTRDIFFIEDDVIEQELDIRIKKQQIGGI